jgi:hypothetical protein
MASKRGEAFGVRLSSAAFGTTERLHYPKNGRGLRALHDAKRFSEPCYKGEVISSILSEDVCPGASVRLSSETLHDSTQTI